MNPTFRLSNRSFKVASAVLDLSASPPTLDIETAPEAFDGEHWAPYLYHHGLELGTLDAHALQGTSHVLAPAAEAVLAHKDSGYLYVFGHEECSQARLHFGQLVGDQIEVFVQGVCDVMWNDEFGANVPFDGLCLATVIPA